MTKKIIIDPAFWELFPECGIYGDYAWDEWLNKMKTRTQDSFELPKCQDYALIWLSDDANWPNE